MASFSWWLITNTCALLVSLALVVYAYFRWSYQYWRRKGVPYSEPSVPLGNFGGAVKVHAGVRLQNFYRTFKERGCKHVGLYMFASPFYMPIDPQIIKDVISKDFRYFTDRGLYQNERDEPLSGHLIAMGGAKWKGLRSKLTPTFTSAKIKAMFPILRECSQNLLTNVRNQTSPFEIKEVLSCYTTDVIGSCAFGLDCNSFKEPDAPFRKHGRMLFEMTRLRSLKRLFSFAFPHLARLLRLKVMIPEVTQFFVHIVEETVRYRRSNKVKRNDFMQLLIELEDLTVPQMAAQAFAFFVAGFETSSTTMAFCLYQLALNPHVQKRTRDEVLDVLEANGNHFTFEAVQAMKYLEQVIEETLRMYPALPMLNRECVEDYQVSGVDLVLEKGTRLIIPVLGLHNDPEYFPEPEKFDPERFGEENRRKIRPFTYLPFGDGPRNCIGSKFGILQSKVGLAVLISNYEFRVNKRMPNPIQMAPKGNVLAAKGGIWLDVHEIASSTYCS